MRKKQPLESGNGSVAGGGDYSQPNVICTKV